MKILVMTRLFTGLIDSIRTKEWKPKGIPAIYKLIEELDNRDIEEQIKSLILHDIIVPFNQ